MNSAPRGLGRGMEALIPADFDDSLLLSGADRIRHLNPADVVPNPAQPRRRFDDSDMASLITSIRLHGILQPVIVTPLKDGRYQLVAGERRWRAAKQAGLSRLPAVIRHQAELEQLEVALIENVERVDLSALEQAATLERLHRQFGVSYKQLGQRLGRAETTIINIVRLLKLPPPAAEALTGGKITEGHARCILALENRPRLQTALLEKIIALGWTVRRAEQYVNSRRASKVPRSAPKDRFTPPAARQMATWLGRPVTVRRLKRGGRLEITFSSEAQLTQLLAKIMSGAG